MSTTIHIAQLSKTFGDKELFHNITINFQPGDKIGIVGKNGCGKTTFLKILAREEPMDTGGIGNKNSVAYMHQDITSDPSMTVYDYLLQFIQAWEEFKIYPLMEELNLSIDLFQPVQTLSGGEQKKIQLLAILLQEADLLLLDEPTNHLDQSSLEILQKCIMEHPGIVLFVSHDRHFLNMMCNKILEIEDKKIIVYTGNYEDYKIEKQKRHEKQLQEHAAYEKERKQRELRLADMRQRASVYISPALGRLIKSKEKYIEREVYANAVDKPKTERAISLQAAGGTHRGKSILEFSKQNIGYDDIVLIQKASMEIRGKDRIHITGKNGSGKTTLLKYIVSLLNGSVAKENIKVGNNITFDYFDQHNEILQSQEHVYSRFEKNLKTKTDERGIRSQLAMIGLTPQEIKGKINNLSHGQKVKMKFLQMLSAPIDILILDEPTNHLDIPTRETIETMLEGYEGALLFVSHDQYFANQIHINLEYHIQDKKLEKLSHLYL